MPDGFHDLRFPIAISFGATGGPERRNEIVRLQSGAERRNQRHAHSRRRFDIGTGVRSTGDLEAVISFFEARRGSIHAFRFRDPFDWKSCATDSEPTPHDQPIATGDGVTQTFQLVKTYGDGSDAYRRPVTLPVAGTVMAALDGVPVMPAEMTVDTEQGRIIFGTAPAAGVAVTAGYAFDIAVRFDIDHLQVSLTSFRAGAIPAIPVVETQR